MAKMMVIMLVVMIPTIWNSPRTTQSLANQLALQKTMNPQLLRCVKQVPGNGLGNNTYLLWLDATLSISLAFVNQC